MAAQRGIVFRIASLDPALSQSAGRPCKAGGNTGQRRHPREKA